MIWFTADNHFGHGNIIKFCPNTRKFKNAEEMNATMQKRWNERVAPEDTIYVLGDFSLMRKEWVKDQLSVLNGFKILIKGNHDKSKANLFHAVIDTAILRLAGRPVILSHYPYNNPQAADERYKDMRPIDKGHWLLHGHIHDLWKIKGKQINVGVDAWDFYPVSKDTLEKLILRGGRDE